MIALNYGKYQAPAELIQLIDLQAALRNEGLLPYGDLLGYYFSLEGLDSRYVNTPLDVISFARTGVDGIHYGFLTDFGQVHDLQAAYIVRVSPMDFDNPVNIVAKNLQDFLRIIFYYPDAMDLIDLTQTKHTVEQYLTDFSTPFETEDNENQMKERLLKMINLEPIESLSSYLQQLKNERQSNTILFTDDHIGIVNKQLPNVQSSNQQMFNFTGVDSINLADVKTFFHHASYEAKLAFLRDGQSKGLFFDNPELKSYLKEQLPLLGLDDEAERISYP